MESPALSWGQALPCCPLAEGPTTRATGVQQVRVKGNWLWPQEPGFQSQPHLRSLWETSSVGTAGACPFLGLSGGAGGHCPRQRWQQPFLARSMSLALGPPGSGLAERAEVMLSGATTPASCWPEVSICKAWMPLSACSWESLLRTMQGLLRAQDSPEHSESRPACQEEGNARGNRNGTRSESQQSSQVLSK